MVRRRDLFDPFCQLFIRFLVPALTAQADGQYWPNAIHFWVPREHLLEYARGHINLTPIIEHLCAESLNQRMIRFHESALIEFE